MSQENVEIVLSVQLPPDVDCAPIYRDDSRWAAALGAMASRFLAEFEIVARGLPDGERVYVGMEGLRAFWLDWLTPWSTYRAEVVKARDLGERVLVLYRAFGRDHDGAPEVRLDAAWIFTVRGGKIAQAEPYVNAAEALRAVGLEE